jgi:hypothetical protein
MDLTPPVVDTVRPVTELREGKDAAAAEETDGGVVIVGPDTAIELYPFHQVPQISEYANRPQLADHKFQQLIAVAAKSFYVPEEALRKEMHRLSKRITRRMSVPKSAHPSLLCSQRRQQNCVCHDRFVHDHQPQAAHRNVRSFLRQTCKVTDNNKDWISYAELVTKCMNFLYNKPELVLRMPHLPNQRVKTSTGFKGQVYVGQQLRHLLCEASLRVVKDEDSGRKVRTTVFRRVKYRIPDVKPVDVKPIDVKPADVKPHTVKRPARVLFTEQVQAAPADAFDACEGEEASGNEDTSSSFEEDEDTSSSTSGSEQRRNGHVFEETSQVLLSFSSSRSSNQGLSSLSSQTPSSLDTLSQMF